MRKLTANLLMFGLFFFVYNHAVKPVAKAGAKGTVKTVKVAKKVIV